MNGDQIKKHLGKRVRLNYLTGGDHHAEGTLVGYFSEPTVIIETDSGEQIAWLAKIAEAIEDES
jgi:hypothetical protein